MELVIECQEIDFSYKSDKQIINDLSLSVGKNETVALIGANGAGKSTLLRLIAGLIEPDRGQVLVLGEKMDKKSFSSFRTRIGYTFQNADHQLFMPTVWEDVSFGPRHSGIKGKELEEMVELALALAGASHLSSRQTHKLSGGEKRSSSIATAIVMKPDILLMDEPGSGLDPRGRRKLIETLKNLDTAKIIATHDLDMALEICDKVALVSEGRIIKCSKPEEILFDEQLLLENGLEVPLTAKLQKMVEKLEEIK